MAQALLAPTTANFVQKTLGASLSAGVTTMTLNNTTNIPNLPGVCIVDRINSPDVETPSAREVIKYTGTSGSTLTGLTRNADSSGSDQDHAINAIVEFVPDALWADSIYDALTETVVASTGALDTTKVVDLTTTQTLTNKTLTSPKIGTGINDTNGNELFKLTATASAVNEITQANAATGNSPVTSMTGDDTSIGWDVKMKGTGKFRKPTVIEVPVVAAGTSTATGDAKAFFRVPAELNGMNLTGVAACVYTAGTTNTTDIQIRNKTQTADMLTTKLTIDSGETDSSTAAIAAVIDTGNDDVATGDVIAIDVDQVSTTPAQGLVVELRFELP